MDGSFYKASALRGRYAARKVYETFRAMGREFKMSDSVDWRCSMRHEFIKAFFVLPLFLLSIADKSVAGGTSDGTSTLCCHVLPSGDFAPIYDNPEGNVVADIYPGYGERLAVELEVRPTESDFWQIVSYYDVDIDDDKQSKQYVGLFVSRYMLAVTTRVPTALRTEPSKQSQIVYSIEKHETVRLVALKGEWLKVSLTSITDEQGCHKVMEDYITGWIKIEDSCGSVWPRCD